MVQRTKTNEHILVQMLKNGNATTQILTWTWKACSREQVDTTIPAVLNMLASDVWMLKIAATKVRLEHSDTRPIFRPIFRQSRAEPSRQAPLLLVAKRYSECRSNPANENNNSPKNTVHNRAYILYGACTHDSSRASSVSLFRMVEVRSLAYFLFSTLACKSRALPTQFQAQSNGHRMCTRAPRLSRSYCTCTWRTSSG